MKIKLVFALRFRLLFPGDFAKIGAMNPMYLQVRGIIAVRKRANSFLTPLPSGANLGAALFMYGALGAWV